MEVALVEGLQVGVDVAGGEGGPLLLEHRGDSRGLRGRGARTGDAVDVRADGILRIDPDGSLVPAAAAVHVVEADGEGVLAAEVRRVGGDGVEPLLEPLAAGGGRHRARAADARAVEEGLVDVVEEAERGDEVRPGGPGRQREGEAVPAEAVVVGERGAVAGDLDVLPRGVVELRRGVGRVIALRELPGALQVEGDARGLRRGSGRRGSGRRCGRGYGGGGDAEGCREGGHCGDGDQTPSGDVMRHGFLLPRGMPGVDARYVAVHVHGFGDESPVNVHAESRIAATGMSMRGAGPAHMCTRQAEPRQTTGHSRTCPPASGASPRSCRSTDSAAARPSRSAG